MTRDIDGLRAIVTAGGAGIGRAIVDVLAEEGARVITCDIDPDAVAEVGGVTGVEARVADVGSTSAIDDFMERALGILGGVDLLVNNAGIAARLVASRPSTRRRSPLAST